MAPEPKSKKSPPVESDHSLDAQVDPDGFLSVLDSWGTKPNPASFEKLLEANQGRFAKALDQGYTADDICKLAASYGIQVKPSTFRKYWQRLKSRQSSNSSVSGDLNRQAVEALSEQDSAASTSGNSAVNF